MKLKKDTNNKHEAKRSATSTASFARSINILKIISAISFLSILFFTNPVFGQTSSTQTVTVAQFLSFTEVPNSFKFPSIAAPSIDTNIFSDTGTNLGASRILTVNDTRNTGGFIVQATATPFTGANGAVIPNSGFRIGSSTNISPALDGTIDNKIIYRSNTTGETGINAGINITLGPSCDNFADMNIFTDPVCQQDSANNILSGTVDIMEGTLAANKGRTGEISVGITYGLTVPAFTIPDTYNSTVTFTVLDSTN